MSGLLEAVARHGSERPTAVALRSGDVTLSYRDVVDSVERAAVGLAGLGIRPGERVAVLGTKSVPAVLALLAVLRAGCAYVPLDPKAPAGRLAGLLADAGCRVLLHDDDVDVPWKADGVRALGLRELSGQRSGPLPEERDEDSVAYCLYTSGSTGHPKGVQISHRALGAFLRAVHPLLEAGPDARCLNTSALHFDVSVVDLLYPLWCGASVRIGPDVPLPARLAGTIERERITHLAAVGSTLALVATGTRGFAGRDISSLRRLMTGAEVLDPRAVNAWLAAAPGLTVINGYGPTEATCLAVAHLIAEYEPDRTEAYPLGRELSGITVRFLAGDDVTTDGPGEILIAGDQVMNGYLARPEEEARAFIDIGDTRFYRTGDLGRRDSDGSVAFAGRRDDEIKHRGYRVNLQEIALALQSHPRVSRAFVAPGPHGSGRQELWCAVLWADAPASGEDVGRPLLVPATGADADELRRHAAELLPAYMLPGAYAKLSHLPVLSNGKPDVKTVKATLAKGGWTAVPEFTSSTLSSSPTLPSSKGVSEHAC
ncbi:amino acid adenylation domain-containing protein [Streptomyces sp. NPDC055400]